jgi:DHA1 family bicyclomycin/chloramphenicol resistance-like MFS transporter
MLIAPLVAPAVGVALLNLAGWQSIFFMLAGYGMMLMLLVRFPLPTVPRRQDNETLWHRLFNAYGRVLRNRPAMGFILANALAFSALFVFITDAAFLYMDHFGISPDQFPLYFGANVVTMLGLNRLNVVLLRRYASADIMRAGLILQALAGVALLVLTLTDNLVLWAVVPLIMVTAGMVALVIPNGIASFLSLFDRDSGAATGLNGTLQFLLAGLIGTVLGAWHDGTPVPMTLLMAGSSITALAAFLWLRKGAEDQVS